MLIPQSYRVETERLILRLPSVDEIPATFSATRYKGFNDGMLWDPPRSEEELLQPFHNNIKAWENEEGFTFSILIKETNLFIGRIAIRKEPKPGKWNLGFWMHPQHQNKGYMTEAAMAIIRLGFEQLSAEIIIADHALWNKASEAVLKKCGMVLSEYIQKGFKKNDIWVEENRLEITRAIWLRKTP
jgi:ribosomal-protein-alanine N-acetyltransferase